MTAFIEYFSSNAPMLLQYTIEHLRIGLLAVVFGILVGVPFGLLIARIPGARKPVLGCSSVIQAIPSLAFMGFLIPIIGIGDKTAILIIALYALLPIIRNTYTGLTNIDKSILEAADGIGLTSRQKLFKVQLPLAMPVIMAGIRVAAVNSIGTATIAAFIGGGGLGKQVYAGIQIINTNMILSGAIPACLLALLIDQIFGLVEKAVVPISVQIAGTQISREKVVKMKRRRSTVLLTAILILALMLGSVTYDTIKSMDKAGIITVASTEYIEERIVTELYAQMIEEYTDLSVVRNSSMGSNLIVWEAVKNNEIDVHPAYSGTFYATILGLPTYPGMLPDDTYNAVSDELGNYGLQAVGQLGPNNQYVFAVKPEFASRHNLTTVSDLSRIAPSLTVGCSQSFYARTADGFFPVCEAYGMSFADALTFGAAPMYLALENDEVDVIVTYRTDGLLEKYDLVFLEDDLHFFPPYVLFGVVSERVIEEYPEVIDVLLQLEFAVTDEEMREMNNRGAEQGHLPYDIARDFLISKGFISEE